MATPIITRVVPITRNNGVQVPGLVNAPTWVDSLVLVGGVAGSYTPPADAQTPAQRGSIFRISADGGPLYANWNGTASVPAHVTDGTASQMLRTDLGPVFVVAPNWNDTLSLFAVGAAHVVIEVWG